MKQKRPRIKGDDLVNDTEMGPGKEQHIRLDMYMCDGFEQNQKNLALVGHDFQAHPSQ